MSGGLLLMAMWSKILCGVLSAEISIS